MASLLFNRPRTTTSPTNSPSYDIDPELSERQQEYELLCSSQPTVESSSSSKKYYLSPKELKSYFRGLDSDGVRADVASIWMEDSFRARRIQYPGELSC